MPPILSSLLGESNIQVQVRARSWSDLVRVAGELLLATRQVEPRYVLAMEEMVRSEGAYMVVVPGLALLHARPEAGALGECLSLVTSAEPVYFGHPTNDPVDLAIAFAAGHPSGHLQVMAEIARFLQDESSLAAVRRAKQVQEVREIIRDYEQSGRKTND